MVDLSEYEQLRNEINNRAQLSGALVGLQLTVLAAGLAVTNNFPDIVVALAALSSLLWLLWIDHSSQIFKIAAYIGLCLAPRLREGDAELLGWEHFVRIIDQGGQEATKALFGPSSSKRFKPLRTAAISRFIFLLFGASPPLLIAGFIFVNSKQFSDWNSILSLHGFILVLASIVWIYACRQYWLFVKMRDTIDEALLQAPKMHIQEKQVHKSGSS
jgi:hypothetical protein